MHPHNYEMDNQKSNVSKNFSMIEEQKAGQPRPSVRKEDVVVEETRKTTKPRVTKVELMNVPAEIIHRYKAGPKSKTKKRELKEIIDNTTEDKDTSEEDVDMEKNRSGGRRAVAVLGKRGVLPKRREQMAIHDSRRKARLPQRWKPPRRSFHLRMKQSKRMGAHRVKNHVAQEDHQ